MQAIVIREFGDASVLQVRQVPAPQYGPSEIRVQVRATALNRADILQRLGHYPPPHGTRPDIPGLEYAGIVAAIGKRVTLFRPGDRVMGLLPGEGYAEQIVSHERMALPMPANLSFEQAAAIPEAFLTAYDALFRQLKVQTGECCLIHAVGSGVGLAALQLANVTGVTTFGTAGSDDKLAKARRAGLDFGINYRTEDFQKIVLSETACNGVDAIIDTVGAAYWHQNIAALAIKGRLALLGLLGGARTDIDLADLLVKRITVVGSVLRARPLEEKISLSQEFGRKILPLFEREKLMPNVDSVFSWKDVAKAHRHMEAARNFGKIVLRIE